MPFQVSYSFKATPVGVINFFSAGEDQFPVCDTSVTLTAIVIGDLTGHTIVWEQLTGPAVTFTSPLNQLVVTYTVATFEDRSFRFTIDKGESEEQFDDIGIFGTPTFPYFGGVPASNCIINFGDVLRCNIPVLKVFDAYPTDKTSAVECFTSSEPKLHWDTESETDLLVQYVVQERSVAGPFTDEAILSPGINDYTPLNIGSTYRVVAVRRELNSATSSIPSNSVFVNGLISLTSQPAAAAMDPYESVTSISKEEFIRVPTYTVSLVTLLNCPPDAPDDYFSTQGASAESFIRIPTYTVDELFLISCDPDDPDDYFSTQGASAESFIAVPTYTVLDLTGDDIGGA